LATVEAQFTNASGLAPGDPVRVSGFGVGRVTVIDLRSVGEIHVTFEVPDEMRPHADASVSVASVDFLGAKALDYLPGTSPQMLGEDQVIVGTASTGLLEGSSGLADQATSVLTGLERLLSEETVARIEGLLDAAQGAFQSVERMTTGEGARELTGAVTDLRGVLGRVDSLLANPAIERSANELDEVTTALREMSEGLAGVTGSLNGILAKIEAGEGSLGMAVNDSTLHHETIETLTSMRELLDDMRLRPGRYFNVKVF
jgi:phospholipid/cholesterol/gamma-HCH transport system substrate-binding protein